MCIRDSKHARAQAAAELAARERGLLRELNSERAARERLQEELEAYRGLFMNETVAQEQAAAARARAASDAHDGGGEAAGSASAAVAGAAAADAAERGADADAGADAAGAGALPGGGARRSYLSPFKASSMKLPSSSATKRADAAEERVAALQKLVAQLTESVRDKDAELEAQRSTAKALAMQLEDMRRSLDERERQAAA